MGKGRLYLPVVLCYRNRDQALVANGLEKGTLFSETGSPYAVGAGLILSV